MRYGLHMRTEDELPVPRESSKYSLTSSIGELVLVSFRQDPEVTLMHTSNQCRTVGTEFVVYSTWNLRKLNQHSLL